MPFLVPRTYCPICYEVVRTRFYNSASVVYFCFTLYKTTGDTIYFAYGGLMGTVIAVFNIWALMGFFPGGYVPGTPNAEAIFWMINLWGAVFVFLMLYLNLDGNTRVFGLTTFVWYWMAALNHHVVRPNTLVLPSKLRYSMKKTYKAPHTLIIQKMASAFGWPGTYPPGKKPINAQMLMTAMTVPIKPP